MADKMTLHQCKLELASYGVEVGVGVRLTTLMKLLSLLKEGKLRIKVSENEDANVDDVFPTAADIVELREELVAKESHIVRLRALSESFKVSALETEDALVSRVDELKQEVALLRARAGSSARLSECQTCVSRRACVGGLRDIFAGLGADIRTLRHQYRGFLLDIAGDFEKLGGALSELFGGCRDLGGGTPGVALGGTLGVADGDAAGVGGPERSADVSVSCRGASGGPRVLLLADEYGVGVADALRSKLPADHAVFGMVKPGASFSALGSGCESMLGELGDRDFLVVFAGGPGDAVDCPGMLGSVERSLAKICNRGFKARIIVCSIPYKYDTSVCVSRNELIFRLNKALYRVCSRLAMYNNVVFCDLNRSLGGRFFREGQFLNTIGRKIVADDVLRSMRARWPLDGPCCVRRVKCTGEQRFLD